MRQKYYTYVTNINNEKYLLVFVITIHGFGSKDFEDINKLADKLSICECNVIYDYFYRNGHINYIYNRLYTVVKRNHMLRVLDNDERSFIILKECNKWWSNNIDLLENYIHDKNIERLHELDNINYKYCWF